MTKSKGASSARQLSGITKAIAIHEAAHAVAMWRCQNQVVRYNPPFERIVLRSAEDFAKGPYIDARGREQDCLAIVECKAFYNPYGMHTDNVFKPEDVAGTTMLEDLRKKMECEAMISLAGPLAESRYSRRSLICLLHYGREWKPVDDWVRVKMVIAEFSHSDAEHELFVEDIRKQTRKMLYDKRTWATVLALADHLFSHHSVTYDEALPIMEAAYGAVI